MAVKSKAAQEFVPIQEIRDGVVILKDGTIRMLLMASSINFALKSTDEQQAVLMQFQSFLNSLEFSTQIFIQSRRLDIRPYLNLLEERLKEEVNDLLKIQTREYIGFIKTITQSSNIMSKLFIIVVPYAPPTAISGNKKSSGGIFSIFSKKESSVASTTPLQKNIEAFEEARTQLEQRAGIISQGLSRTGVRVTPLGTEELTELYYRLFNPGEAEKTVSSQQ